MPPQESILNEAQLKSVTPPNSNEKILLLDTNEETRKILVELLQSAGYDTQTLPANAEGLASARQSNAALLIMDECIPGAPCREMLAEWKSAPATQEVRVILLVSGEAIDRALAMDLGADDAVSRPFDPQELLSRVRAQLRAKRTSDELLHKVAIAVEGQQIAHTAFEALAVTEKMTKDASSLNRALKIGVTAILGVAAVMAVIFFVYSHSTQKEQKRATAIIARLEASFKTQQSLVAEARKLRSSQPPDGSSVSAAAPAPQRDALQQKADQLKAQISTADAEQLKDLQKQLAETNARLKKVEAEGSSAENIIGANVSSVCLLHIAVGFTEKGSGKRLHYAGLNPQGEPIQDSDGDPILTLEGPGPEVRIDVFGTGFIAGPNGRVITNRHVAQPWWKDDQMTSLINEGYQPEIAAIRSYFPGSPRAFHAEIDKISEDADLATMRVNLEGLNLHALSFDDAANDTKSGESIVLMGYAAGLAAILARTDESTAQEIATKSGGDVSAILSELARRNLIRPLITQGHVGDVLPDKIVFDAQTTVGGSGGPLLNSEGKVIGITFAILKGFGGSNFGIPARFTAPLLRQ
jgi:DNA-binding response OmpR family regulator/S1-C subfamily serine protease